jgi:hypothetical protein
VTGRTAELLAALDRAGSRGASPRSTLADPLLKRHRLTELFGENVDPQQLLQRVFDFRERLSDSYLTVMSYKMQGMLNTEELIRISNAVLDSVIDDLKHFLAIEGEAKLLGSHEEILCQVFEVLLENAELRKQCNELTQARNQADRSASSSSSSSSAAGEGAAGAGASSSSGASTTTPLRRNLPPRRRTTPVKDMVSSLWHRLVSPITPLPPRQQSVRPGSSTRSSDTRGSNSSPAVSPYLHALTTTQPSASAPHHHQQPASQQQPQQQQPLSFELTEIQQ